MAEEHITILVVEQFAQTALAIADRAAVMVNGRIVRDGTPDEVGDHLLSAYMGERRLSRVPRRPGYAEAATSSSLTFHRRRAASSSCAAFDGVRALHFTKYWPETCATSGDEARKTDVLAPRSALQDERLDHLEPEGQKPLESPSRP